MGDKRKRAGEEETELPYEKERNMRLEQNRQRMSELGLHGLSSHLSSSCMAAKDSKSVRNAKQTPNRNTHLPLGVIRRSSRLQNIASASYKESVEDKFGTDVKKGQLATWREGTKPEIYTEEHEKLLGSWKEPWQLFVDGYDASGSRIYDSVKGKTCHQCRQKTLGNRTWCSCCKALQGQFCGDCLFMRYGENVSEVKQNMQWICPVCRDICNCSLCRPKRGWAPTGALYRKVISLGYKSVAHFLIFTRRAIAENDSSMRG